MKTKTKTLPKRCPCFNEEYIGVCSAAESPYIPSLSEMEEYCFRKDFRCCLLFLKTVNPLISLKKPNRKRTHHGHRGNDSHDVTMN